MADQKISQLTDGGASQATDEYVIARSGSNFRIDGASVAAAATSVGTLSSLTVSGNLTVDTNTLFVDAAANTVSIGSTIAGVALNVASSSANTMAVTRFVANGNANISQAIGRVSFGTNSTTANVIGAEITAAAAEAWTAGSAHGSNLVFGTAANGATAITERLRLTSGGAMVVGNGDTSATPAAATIRGTDGSGTDIAGAALTIQGGRGTGSGKGGDIIFQSSAAGASGTTLRTATEVARVSNTGLITATALGTNSFTVRTGTFPNTMTASTGTLVFTFYIDPGRAGIVRIALACRSNNNTASNSPACEYIGQVHSNSSHVITFNGATTIFEYTFVRATHLAFADLGGGLFTLTLTNPTAVTQAVASTWRAETMGSNPAFSSITVT